MNKFKVGDRVKVTATKEALENMSINPAVISPTNYYLIKQYSEGEYRLDNGYWVWERYLAPQQWDGKVTVDDKEYKIEWAHVRFDLGEPNPHRGLLNDYENHPEKYNLRAMSYCWIIASDAVVVARGMAYCTMSDNFCRKTGRKLSLDRALRGVFSSPDERRQVWEQVLQYPGLVK